MTINCVLCQGRGWCGKSCPILSRIKMLKSVIEATGTELFGSSPPGIFVGRQGYPRVYTGILAPPSKIDVCDMPEEWYSSNATIDDVLGFRGQMIYSRFKADVKNPSGKLIELQQELIQSSKPCDVEITLKKKPKFELRFDMRSSPIGNPALIENAKLAENPKIPKVVDKVVSDTDMKAADAVNKLYLESIPVSSIQKIFTSGLLGLGKNRRLVPTRWGITASDDILSSGLLDKIKTYDTINEYQVFENTYLGNHYAIILMPRVWSYELIEAKFPGSVWNINDKNVYIMTNHETFFKRTEYAEETAGGYYAARLGICEYLEKIRRQATTFVIREVSSEYWAPLGVWVCRETVRNAFNNTVKFNDLESALKYLKPRLIKDISEYRKISKIINQKDLRSFFL